jgi:hypothetical protein
MAGVGAHPTRQGLDHISDAVDAGADYALVLPPATRGSVIDRSRGFFDDDVAAGARHL